MAARGRHDNVKVAGDLGVAPRGKAVEGGPRRANEPGMDTRRRQAPRSTSARPLEIGDGLAMEEAQRRIAQGGHDPQAVPRQDLRPGVVVAPVAFPMHGISMRP